jgi:hypothetical protein
MRLAQFLHALVPFQNGEACMGELDFVLACIKKAHAYYLAPETNSEQRNALGTAHDRLVESLATVRRESAAFLPQVETARGSVQEELNIAEQGEEYALSRVQAVANRMDDFLPQVRRVVHEQQTFWKELNAALDLAEPLIAPDFRKNWRKEWAVRDKQETAAWTFTEAPRCESELRYFFRHLQWLPHRFPEARYRDVPGLCKIATRGEIAAADWSLTWLSPTSTAKTGC